jgi:hypothetical protein
MLHLLQQITLFMMKDQVIQVGNLFPDTPRFKNRTAGRVYDAEGTSPTINTCQGGVKYR